jgi:hypothetical protein
MPLYMDRHKDIEGLSAEALSEAHKKDLEVQPGHGAKALMHSRHRVVCLGTAHREIRLIVEREAPHFHQKKE